MDLEEQIGAEKCFIWKTAFFQEKLLGIGPSWRSMAEIGQKLDFRAVFSEIYIKNEVISSLGHK